MQLSCFCLFKSITWIRGKNPLLNVYLELEALRMIYESLTAFQLHFLFWEAASLPLIDCLDFKTRGSGEQLNTTKVMRRAILRQKLLKFGS